MEHPDENENAASARLHPSEAYTSLAAVAKALQLVMVLAAYCEGGLAALCDLAEGCTSGLELQK